MEDYEKKYKDALAKARKIHRNEAEKRFDMEWLFPELKESEDEKTRKALVRFHKSTIDIDGIKGADILAWLEKQGKQDARYKYLEELLAADDIYQMSVNDTMTKEAKEKAAKALSKLCIGKLLGFEKQGEQKTADKSATTKQEDEIEIPFGAKDSELQEATYYIPKGFHAEIEDDKVVIKRGERSAAWSDEDEHRVEDTIYFLDTAKKHYASTIELDACIDWLKSIKNRIGG